MTATIEDDLKEAITSIIASEYYYRPGGETRHWMEGFEVALTAIVSAFLIPYLKRLAEKSADATWDRIKASLKEVHQPLTIDPDLSRDVGVLLSSVTADEHREALLLAGDSATRILRKYDLSD